MKVLLVHNFYRSQFPSGENRVFEREYELLKHNGYDVRVFVKRSDSLLRYGVMGDSYAALTMAWNPLVYAQMLNEVKSFEPDIVHFHNTFPLISPSAVFAAAKRHATVMTLHNFRLVCAAGSPVLNGSPCFKCFDGASALPGIKHACYRNNRLATVPLALNIELHKFLNTWNKKIDLFLTPSQYQRSLLERTNLAPDKVRVKPHFIEHDIAGLAWSERENVVVYAGRIAENKGVFDLVKAWRLLGGGAPELRIFGDGEDRGRLLADIDGLPIRYMGALTSDTLLRNIARAKLLILPSKSLETFGLAVIEAFSVGTPVLASRIGALAEIVAEGINGDSFEPSDCAALVGAFQRLWQDQARLERLSAQALATFNEKYSLHSALGNLQMMYDDALRLGRERLRHPVIEEKEKDLL